ncbi:MAG: cation-translocating P-type ATPase [Armatimonadota bacterium]
MGNDAPATTNIPWHALPLDELLRRLDARPSGLTAAEARGRLESAGTNELHSAPQAHPLLLFLAQFRSPLIFMLLGASAVSAATGHYVDAGVILAVVILNAFVGVIQEWRAERALEALRQLGAPRALVLRDGRPEVIPALEVVPGDVLVLESGERVSADARVLESIELTVDESALTGESTTVVKAPDDLPSRLPLAERTNMVWMSSPVVAGKGYAVVVETGMRTIMGEIAAEVRSAERAETPLQRRLASLATLLGFGALGLSAVIFFLGLLRGYRIVEMLLFAVAAAVSAIPEGLPAVISVVLALGVQRMARRNAILRRLPAVETLGSTTIICSDKTGTITRNEMTVTRLHAGGVMYEVTGEGFVPEGEIRENGQPVPADRLRQNAALRALLVAGCVANDARLEYEQERWRIHGDPTEAALLVAARKAGIEPEVEREELSRLDEVPFSSRAKYMATLNRAGEDGEPTLFVKGAPEQILAFSSRILRDGREMPLTEEERQRLLEINTELAGRALRVLAAAYRVLPREQQQADRALAEHDLVFLGLWGMIDPPRPEAIRAIADAQGAGIRIIMITGDNAITASAIARQVGIAVHGEETISGPELEEMKDEELQQRVRHAGVFARVAPSHKLRIVGALRANGETTAMTGDGVNDAPALKSADIGVAMGITGTEVAKEAADMVLADDNFATIVRAVEEGRVIFNNLRKVIFFLVTTNLGEIITLTTTLVVGLPLPLTAVMILWVNLVTDGFCTTPLGVEPGHRDVLRQPPRSRDAGVIDLALLRQMLVFAVLMAAGTLGLFWQDLRAGETFAHAQTVAFTTLVAFQWFHAFNARSRRNSLFSIGIFTNSWLLAGIAAAVLLQVLVIYVRPIQVLFRTAPLTLADWGWILLVSSSIFILDELRKLVINRREGKAG